MADTGGTGIGSVLVAGRGPVACGVIRAAEALGVKTVAVHSASEAGARHVRMADEAVLLGPSPAAESYLSVPRLVEAARRSGVDAVLAVPPALAGNAELAASVVAVGLTWVGPPAAVLERLGGDGVEPASAQGFLAVVTPDGLRHVTPVRRDRDAGTARVSWTPPGWPGDGGPVLPRAAQRLPDLGWRGPVTVGIDPDGELAEVAAGLSLDLGVLERAHGVDVVDLALRCATGRLRPDPGTAPRPALAAQLRATLPPGTAGRVIGRLPDLDGPAAADVRAVGGYAPGDRLDGWYDALLATVSAGGPDLATAAARAADVLTGLPETGVPHDGAAVCEVLHRLAAG
ncbi:biotin carboxylase N-terminal domain-containing protein [Klenkia taihuensis]|uniref:biotin carboxylase n=1 Tax=Klenkia taihuensis TaxID=1225127 RepID=A0A1I1K917_9ACTN|nr:biotin carboxylase N-terminal domain-containing protein [Klenkia taihuensis]GHE10435.1 hypothetical protein GCM10011381_19430 [Klenkia taihuensis]SFC57437.1 Biotin carboxylase C-terminal domain-containing protein [Klenkia taihuensis]